MDIERQLAYSSGPKTTQLVTGVLTLVLIALLLLIFSPITIVGAGEVGVVSVFGKVKDRSLSSGMHLVNPLARVTKMDIKTQQYTMSIATQEGERQGDDSIDVLTKEGLTLKLDVTMFYHLIAVESPKVYREIGVEYTDKIVRPEVRNAIREIGSQYTAQELYSSKREDYSGKLAKTLEDRLKTRGIAAENVLIRNIKLPAQLNAAIEQKQAAEQAAQQMQFTLEKEKLEADRKVTEARGIRDSQDIIAQKLSPEYLQWYSIDMMKSLADSPNTTFLFVPTGQNGMPIVNINPAR